MDFAAMKPADLRGLIRKGELTGPTTGMCNGCAQGNLVVLPRRWRGTFCCSASATPKPARCWKWRTQASEPLPNLAKAAILLPISRATGCTNTVS